MNASMPALKACFEAAGFSDVRTLLSSGNVAFDSRSASPAALERRAEKAMQSGLGHGFRTIVRSADSLRRFLDAEPIAEFDLPPHAKRVVTFLRSPRNARGRAADRARWRNHPALLRRRSPFGLCAGSPRARSS
jgi:uncharacterized protein (DUF1697 family)